VSLRARLRVLGTRGVNVNDGGRVHLRKLVSIWVKVTRRFTLIREQTTASTSVCFVKDQFGIGSLSHRAFPALVVHLSTRWYSATPQKIYRPVLLPVFLVAFPALPRPGTCVTIQVSRDTSSIIGALRMIRTEATLICGRFMVRFQTPIGPTDQYTFKYRNCGERLQRWFQG
jgi:hypothetical protein